ncbi:nucleotidyltransferase family protein [Cyanobacteria bacterium FACHB-DQ100]|uniref:nucleotidyltransferase family protein n=1 Tax=Leptolyngbya sp. DQ-M1 TaxID=2933920 RepID=UPI00198372DD|nr:nucleotidyltransferase family protein [Cyanobacteria bacterium FACHB-DQ100]
MGLGIEELLADKREEILAIARKHKAFNIRVFGSVSRGEANAESDVDFLVEMKNHSLLDRIALIQDLEDVLGRKVDVALPENLHELIRDRVLKEAVPL